MVASSSPPSVSSTPSSSLAHDFATLLSTPVAAPGLAPSPAPSGGGVEEQAVPAVAHGKSVVVLPSFVTSAMLCCASIGEGESQKVVKGMQNE